MDNSILLDDASDSLRALRKTHLDLHEELEANAATFRDDLESREKFVYHVDLFIKQLREFVPFARTTGAMNFLNRTAAEWQMNFTTVLRIPRNVYTDLDINSAPDVRESTREFSAKPPLTREFVQNLLSQRAYEIGEKQKMRWLKQLLHDLEQNPKRIHSTEIVPPVRTPEDDWRDACAYFACDILNARFHLALQLSVDAFFFLQSIWLEDVKRLMAYLAWEKAGAAWRPDESDRYYSEACRQLHNRIMDPAYKTGPVSFLPIARWLEEKYLIEGRIDFTNRPASFELVKRKAERIWEITKSADQNDNWRRAESYVRQFYENLIPAIRNGDSRSLEALLAATITRCGTRVSDELVDALEFGLLMYFVEGDKMKPFFASHETYV